MSDHHPEGAGRRGPRVRLLDDRASGRQPTPHDPAATAETHPEPHDPHDHVAPSHEHEHDHDLPGPSGGPFPHEKLDAYRVALQMVAVAKRLASSIPRGHRNVADHLLRSATNVVLLLAEGANRRGSGEKRQRFVESRGECGEVAASADVVLVLDIGSRADAEEAKRLASRVSAMLTGLIARLT